MRGTDLSTTFLDHVDARRDWAATRVGLDLLADGGVDALVDDLLVPTMEQTGARWYAGTYTVADEHHVTTLVDELLCAASLDTPRAVDGQPTVLVACAAGEQHALPGRMLALQLRSRGQGVRYIGASLAAAELEDGLRAGGTEALLVSCTLSAALVGVADMVAVAHRTGVPVLVGGRALRRHREAAAVLGADGRADGVDDVTALLAAWRTRGVVTRAPEIGSDRRGEHAQLGPSRPALVQAVLDALLPGRHPGAECTVEGLVRMLEVSLLLGSPDALHDHVAWLQSREGPGDATGMPVDRVLDAVRLRLPSRLRRSRHYLTEVAARSAG